MQSELQPRVRNTSGENMFPKKHKKGQKTQGSESRWCLRAARPHGGARDLFINTLPPLSFSESIIYPSKQQTLQGRKCKSITKESELQNGEAVTLSKTNSLVIVTVDKTMWIVEKCTVLACDCIFPCLAGRRCLTRCDPERSFCRNDRIESELSGEAVGFSR